MASSSNPSQSQLKAASVKELVDSIIADNQVAIFSKSWCSFSTKAKNLFQTEYADAKTKILELDQRDDGGEIQDYLEKKTGQRTVPNVFVAGEHIGGCDNTIAANKEGKLAKLLKA